MFSFWVMGMTKLVLMPKPILVFISPIGPPSQFHTQGSFHSTASFCGPGWPRTHYVVQARLKFKENFLL